MIDPGELVEAGPDNPYPDDARPVAYADGASRGNPGPAAYGVVYTLEDGTPLAGEGEHIGRETNNVAEWRGLIAALERLDAWGFGSATIRLDSELVVRQMEGRYKVKNAGLKPLHAKASELRKRFAKLTIEHVPRAENALADAMANRALDRAASA